MPEKSMTLHTMLGNYPNTKAIKSGAFRSDLVDFDFVEVKVANNLFKQVVRDAKFDVAELAIVTYLQAATFGKPYVLLPAVLVSRGQHHTIAYNADRGVLEPSDLAGKRVGVRAYTVTTGTWVRGILAGDYGVDLDKVEWITFEDPACGGVSRSSIIKRAPPGKELAAMLLDGELDAAVVGDKLPDPRLEAAHSRCRCRGAPVGKGAQRRADQPYGGGAQGAVGLAARRGARGLPAAGREQARRRIAGRRNAARSAPLRGRSLPAQPGDHHRLLPPAAAHPSAPLGGRAVRRHHPRPESRIARLTRQFTAAARP